MTTAAPGAALDPVGVEARLPHRFPFLLVDRVQELVPGKGGRGIKGISAGELLGPGQAFPGLLILEAGAQLLGLVAGAAGGEPPAEPAVGYLAAIQEFHCHRAVKAGDLLQVEVELGRRFGPLLQGRVRALVAGELVAEGRLTATNGGAPGAGR